MDLELTQALTSVRITFYNELCFLNADESVESELVRSNLDCASRCTTRTDCLGWEAPTVLQNRCVLHTNEDRLASCLTQLQDNPTNVLFWKTTPGDTTKTVYTTTESINVPTTTTTATPTKTKTTPMTTTPTTPSITTLTATTVSQCYRGPYGTDNGTSFNWQNIFSGKIIRIDFQTVYGVLTGLRFKYTNDATTEWIGSLQGGYVGQTLQANEYVNKLILYYGTDNTRLRGIKFNTNIGTLQSGSFSEPNIYNADGNTLKYLKGTYGGGVINSITAVFNNC